MSMVQIQAGFSKNLGNNIECTCASEIIGTIRLNMIGDIIRDIHQE